MEITYDLELALIFQDRFASHETIRQRSEAARCIIENRTNLDSIDQLGDKLCVIDWVLFYLEDVGFYVDGMKMSPEVAYHHFYHWVRGYYLLTYPYIKAWQKKPHEKRRWEHFENLYKLTSQVAIQKGEITSLNKQELDKFIEEERDLLSDDRVFKCPLH